MLSKAYLDGLVSAGHIPAGLNSDDARNAVADYFEWMACKAEQYFREHPSADVADFAKWIEGERPQFLRSC